MKLTAAIFAFFVLFMPLQPVISSINYLIKQVEKAEDVCCKKIKSCCARIKKQNEKSPHRSCDKKNCPIEICGYCFYIGANRLILEKPYTIIESENPLIRNERIISSFINDCFHPPEVVLL